MSIFKADLRQRDLEKFEELYNGKYEPAQKFGAVSPAGAIVRAAVEAGWATGVTLEAVDGMKAKEVRALSVEISELYVQAVELDPK